MITDVFFENPAVQQRNTLSSNIKKHFLTYILTVSVLLAFSQDKDLLKRQFDFAQKTQNYLEGFSQNLGNNDFEYHSLRKDVPDCLLTRSTDGNMAIEWETQAVPESYKGKSASFVWLTALDLTTKTNGFDVFVDDIKRFEIISGNRESWKLEHKEGGELEFITFTKDQHGDAHGYMMLKAPKRWIAPGKPLKITIVGHNDNEPTWIIVYKAKDNLSYLANAAQYETWMDLYCESQNDGYTVNIEAPGHLQETSVHLMFGDEKHEVLLKNKNGVASASVYLKKNNNPHLIVSDGINRLIDIENINRETSKQIILSKSLLIIESKKYGNNIEISSRRVYTPNTVASILNLAKSELNNSTIYLMNSSHQDIAWMDSPEKCVVERDTMLISPLINSLEAKPYLRFDVEDALMIKEYIERHPEKKAFIRQLLNNGTISCGSTFIQPYEEMYSGEALARQFYFGAKWLKNEFDYNANTYWNVDVPGRTPQMPQIMKKAGTDFMMISRHERGIFYWAAPDGSSILTFSPGHYYDGFVPLQKDFYEAAEYIATSTLDWEIFFDSNTTQPVIPILSSADMSPVHDYSHIINRWESIAELEVNPGKTVSVSLPKFKIATSPEFMQAFEQSATKIPSIKGERPAVWLYIHGPGHQKALKASRRGDILLTMAEKFAAMDAMSQNSFSDYPQKRLNNAWEAKIFPDHGWGGKHGDITDDLFRRKFEFAHNEASQIIENATQSLAGHIKTKQNAGIPIVVFNSLSWTRNDLIRCTLNFDEGEASDFVIQDAKNKVVDYQKLKTERYNDNSLKSVDVCFMASEIPSIGYATFYAMTANVPLTKEKEKQQDSFENDFYKIEFTDGGLSSIYDKELGVELLNTEKFKGGEVFTMKSEGNGAGEFDDVQKPTMEGFDKASNYKTQWELVSEGPVYSSYKIRQQIRNAVVEEIITIYHKIKKIDFDVALLNWEGILYREFRMAIPLNMENARVAYEVPFGVTEVGKDEIEGAAGERYLTPAADIRPRGIENWIGANNNAFGVTLSSSVAVADYIDPTDNPVDYTILQPVLLASRKSCHWEGNEYLQTGNHYFSFSLTSHHPGWKNGFRFGKQANEKLVSVVNPPLYSKAFLPEINSFFNLDSDNVIVSAIKKCDDDNSFIVRLYDIAGENSTFNLRLDNKFSIRKAFYTSLIEEEISEQLHTDNIIPINLKPYSIETFKVFIKTGETLKR